MGLAMKTDRVRGVTCAGMASTIGFQIALGRNSRLGPCRKNGDAIDEEPVLGVDRLVARAEIGLGEHMEQLVGTVSADDVRRVRPDPEKPPRASRREA